VEEQQHNLDLKPKADKEGYSNQLVKNIKVLCKGRKIVIPKSLQHRAIAWYHHY
jgi:hypothetical protein